MAVVQISRIQVRRGKKNQGSGLPQLASGEFGWAVDAQELYIGNGSVSEGSPQVGNTRILTANDNLFDFATQYTFRANEPEDLVQTGIDVSTPIVRSVQQRLDERVSLASFGIDGDSNLSYDFNLPTEDVTSKLQHAINQLYLSSVAKNSLTQRVQLFIPAGHYTLSDTIYLPPFVTLVGEDVDKTIFHSTAQIAFRTVTGDSSYTGTEMQFVYDDPSISYNGNPGTQTRSILLQNFTIDILQPTAVAVLLESTIESEVKDLKITGTYDNSLTYANDQGSAFVLKQLNNVVQTKHLKFSNVTVDGFNKAFNLKELVNKNMFDNVLVKNSGYGFVLTEAENNEVKNSLFENIDNQGFLVINGNYNVSRDNEYLRVGNLGGEETAAAYPVIEFSGNGNRSQNDAFNRTKTLGSNNSTYVTIPYKPEIKGPGIHESNFNYRAQITYAPVNEEILIRLPAAFKTTAKIKYSYNSSDNNLVRNGEVTVTYNPSVGVYLVDNYDGIAADESSLDALVFSAEHVAGTESISIKFLNTLTETSEVYMNYNISYYQ